MKRSAPPTLLCLLVSCSAPDTSAPAPAPDPALPTEFAPPPSDPAGTGSPGEPPPTPEDIAAAAQGEAPPTPEDIAAAADGDAAAPLPAEAAPPEAAADAAPERPEVADPSASWGAGPATPPYTAWTTRAGVELAGPGGRALLALPRGGIRVEVVAEQGGRVNVQCRACPDPWRDGGGWLPRDAVQPAERAVPAESPLSVALPARARWVVGQDLPAEGAQTALCRLLDHGYELSADGRQARWSTPDGGELIVEKAAGAGAGGEGWVLREGGVVVPQGSAAAWSCPVTSPAGG